jgi:hypothetical protein
MSQQVQWITFQLLVKEYSPLPLHEPSIQFYRGPLETTQVNPWDKYHHTYPYLPIVSKKQLEESSPISPTAVGYSSQRGELLGVGT